MSTRRLRLSVLETGPPSHAVALAPELSDFGYERYWMAEHYSPTQSPAPLVLAAAVAATIRDRSMRVGTAGVLLNLRTPESVVADASVLGALHRGLVDLGVAAAGTGDPGLDEALRSGGQGCSPPSYAERVESLCALVDQRATPLDRGDALEPAHLLGPCNVPPPEIWVCGTSMRSAEIAARSGSSYAFHQGLAAPDADGPGIVRHYIDRFCGRRPGDRPQAAVALWGCVGRSDSAVDFSGEPLRARAQILACTEMFGVERMVVSELDPELVRQRRTYEQLAALNGLEL